MANAQMLPIIVFSVLLGVAITLSGSRGERAAAWFQDINHVIMRLVTLVIGGSIVLLGIAMIFLPGPAVLVIPFGIVILAGEFAWARRLRRRVEELATTVTGSEAEADAADSAREQNAEAIEQEPRGGDRTE